MVHLLCQEHEKVSRPTTDIDLLGNARSRPSGTSRISQLLSDSGASLSPPPRTSENTGYQFLWREQTVEVLGPDGLPTDPETLPGYRTIQAKGGTQALKRAEKVLVKVGGSEVIVRRPSLLGAILMKARALISIPSRRDEHLEDLLSLLGLVADPREMAEKDKMTRSEQKWLRRVEKYMPWVNGDQVAYLPEMEDAFDLLTALSTKH